MFKNDKMNSETKNKEILNILFASNNEYSPFLGVSLYSLLKNNINDFNQIKIFILDDEINEENKEKIKNIAKKFDTEINFFKTKNIEKTIGENTYYMNKDGIKSMTPYSRLFSASILPKIDKVLYMDSDSLILNSFKELWKMDIDDYYCAGVIDTLGIDYVKNQIDLEKKFDYINSGFLLINLKKWREERIEEKFLKFLKEHNDKFIFHDQGIINGVLKNKIIYLHPKYNLLGNFQGISYNKAIKIAGSPNYYDKKTIEEAKNNPIFVHFCGGAITKPWNNKKHVYYKIYKEYSDQTPFKEEINSKQEVSRLEHLIYKIYLNNISDIPFMILPTQTSVKLANYRLKKICEGENININKDI